MKRHTRAHVREQRNRWIWKRIRRIRTEWPKRDDEVPNRSHLPGKLNKQDPWDCGNTQCGICRFGGYERRCLREQAAAKCELSELDERQ